MLLMVLPQQAILWTTTPFGRRPLWTTTPLDDDLFGRRPLWTTTLDNNLFGQQPLWTTTPLDDNIDNIGGSATRGYMSRPVFSWMLCCESSQCEAEDYSICSVVRARILQPRTSICLVVRARIAQTRTRICGSTRCE
jgi:hypothetical protein